MKITAIPTAALVPGLPGLIPFFAAPVLAGLHAAAGASIATEAAMYTIYGAIILSFLGGVRWGGFIQTQTPPRLDDLVAAILPSLAGCLAVFAHWAWGAPVGWGLIIAGLAAQFIWDRRAVTAGSLPAWYGQLRLLLSTGAIGSGAALLVIYFSAIA